MVCLFMFLCYVVSVCGFSEKKNVNRIGKRQMTDQHYIELFDKLAETKHSRKLVEQTIIGLQNELKSAYQELLTIKQQKGTVSKDNISTLYREYSSMKQTIVLLKQSNAALRDSVLTLKNNFTKFQFEYDTLKDSVNLLQKKYELLQKDNFNLKDNLQELQNITLNIKDQFDRFVNSSEGKKLSAVKSIQQELSEKRSYIAKLFKELDSFKMTYNARNQDFVAFIKDIGQVNEQINTIQTNNALIAKNGHEFANVSVILNGTFTTLKQIKFDTSGGIVLTACSQGSTGHAANSDISYNSVSSSFGVISSARLGYFKATETGLYLVSATSMSYSSTGYFYVYKNSDRLTTVYVAKQSRESSSYTGTTVLSVFLNIGDTIRVKVGVGMHIYGPGTCLTLAKIN